VVTEIVYLNIKPGEAKEFEAKVAQAKPHFLSANGCHGISLARSIENPDQYRLFVKWDTVDHHMVEFRQSEGFQAWRALAGPHFADAPQVEHVSDIDL
jgi:quinol monooxygenase YgiN